MSDTPSDTPRFHEGVRVRVDSFQSWEKLRGKTGTVESVKREIGGWRYKVNMDDGNVLFFWGGSLEPLEPPGQTFAFTPDGKLADFARDDDSLEARLEAALREARFYRGIIDAVIANTPEDVPLPATYDNPLLQIAFDYGVLRGAARIGRIARQALSAEPTDAT